MDVRRKSTIDLGSLSTDATSKLDILGHDCHTLGVDSTQVGILEKTNQVSFSSFLEGKNSGGLEAKVTLEILGDLTDETLERSFADEKVGRLLVLANLTKSYSSWAVPVWLLHTTCGRGGLAGSLRAGRNRQVVSVMVKTENARFYGESRQNHRHGGYD